LRRKKLEIELFKIKGIPVRINASWLIIFALLINSVFFGEIRQVYPQAGNTVWIILSLAFVLLFFASLILHEAAHSIVAKRMNIDVSDITLYVFGGAARILREPERPVDEIKMALSGPFVSLLISGFSYLLYVLLNLLYLEPLSLAFYLLSLANLAIGIFNLIPAFPLDGGRVLRSLLWLGFGDRLKATSVSSGLSKLIAALVFLLGIYLGAFVSSDGLWLSFIAAVLFFFSNKSLEVAYQSEILGKRLKDLFSYEQIFEISLPAPREINYETTVLLKSDDTVYFTLKLLRSDNFKLVRMIWNDVIVYLRPADLLNSIYLLLENSKKYAHKIK
jgi:Zn-dependent protease